VDLRRLVRSLSFAGLAVAWWYYLVSHYYSVLNDWAEQMLWRTQPLMYASIEWWLLVSLMVCTYLAIRLVDEITKGGD